MSDIRNEYLDKVSFDEILNSFPIPTYVWKKKEEDLVLLRYNIAADRIVKGKMFDYVGIKASEFFKKNRHVLEDLLICLKNKTTISKELEWCYESTGKKILLRARYNFIPPYYVLVCTEDITEQRKRELEYVVTENALESSMNAVVLTDFDGNISYINNACVKLWGCDNNEDIIGKSMFSFWHDKKLGKGVIKYLKEKEKWFGNIVTVKNDGTPLYVELAAHLIKNKEGTPLCLMGSFIDISEKVEINKTLKKTLEALKGLELIVNQSPAVVILFNFDEEWSVEFITKNIERYGYEQKEFYSQKLTLYKIINPEDFIELIQIIKSPVIEEGDEFEKEFRLISKLKDTYWVDCHFLVRRNKKGHITQIQGIFMDITERKRFEMQLKESEEKFRTIAEQSLMGIVIYQDGVIKYANQALTELSEYSLEEIINWPINKFMERIHPEDRHIILERIKEKLNMDHGQLSRYSAKFITKSKKVKFLEIISKKISYKGKPAIIATTIDITDQKLIEKQLIEINKDLKKNAEDKFQKVFNSANDAIIIHDLEEHQIIDFNDKLCEMFGYSREEIFKFTIDFIGNNIILSELNEMRAIFQKTLVEEPQIFEWQAKKKDGRLFWVEFSLRKAEIMEKQYVIAIIRDVTQRKAVEHELRNAKENYEYLIGNILDVITEIDENDRIQYISPNVFDVLGYKREELIGKSVFLFFHPDDIDSVKEQFTNIKIGEGFSIEHRGIRKDKSIRYFLSRGKFVLKNNKDCIISVSRDITEEKELFKKYSEAYSRSDFFKDLFTHDMNNIISNIKSSIDLCYMYLQEGYEKEKIDEMYLIIMEEFNKGKHLISNIRKLSKLENIQPKLIKTNIFEIAENAINSIKAKYRSRTINIDLQENLNEYNVLANEFLIDVFDNILNNAIRYNENQIIEIKLQAYKKIFNNIESVRLEFIDNGIGIPDDRKELIFKQGFLDQKKTKGMGIGLTLVKNILESCEGKIWVEDKISGDYKKGSKFIIILPAAL